MLLLLLLLLLLFFTVIKLGILKQAHREKPNVSGFGVSFIFTIFFQRSFFFIKILNSKIDGTILGKVII